MVLKTADFKESDKLVWLYTEKLGKISAIAKGAKRSKSKFLSLTLPFCYGDYVVFKGKNLYTISEGEVIQSFQNLLRDLDTLTYSSYLCELIDISMIEEESNHDLFKEFVSVFYLIKGEAGDIETLVYAFEIKLLAATGYGLNLEFCTHCKKRIATSNFIDIQSLGGVCKECTSLNGVNISNTTYNALKYLIKLPIEKVYRLQLNPETKKELRKLLSMFISQNYARRPKSLDFLNIIKDGESHE